MNMNDRIERREYTRGFMREHPVQCAACRYYYQCKAEVEEDG